MFAIIVQARRNDFRVGVGALADHGHLRLTKKKIKWEKREKKEGRRGNVLFNDALTTFYLQLYGVRHMVNDHSDSERGIFATG